MSGNLIQANAIQIPLRDESVQLCCFSPPYFGLRKYKISDVQFPDGYVGQLGLEKSIDQFLDHLMLVMEEVWRVLRDDGICFVNIGDSYATTNPAGNRTATGKSGLNCFTQDYIPPGHRKDTCVDGEKRQLCGLKPKSLCLIPQKFAIRCQEMGWIIRSEIIWEKRNPMPESCKDRPTKAHEQVWLLTKTGKYFWDQKAVAQPQAEHERARRLRKKRQGHKAVSVLQADGKTGQSPQSASGACRNVQARQELAEKGTRNIRTVWTLSTEPTPEAHFATFPSKLVEIMIRAGSSPRACEICGAPWERIVKKTFIPQEDVSLERGVRCVSGQKPLDETDNRGGFPRGSNQTKTLGWGPTCKCDCKGTGRCVILDPFVGTGTTVLVAERLGRIGVGLDLSEEYLWKIARGKIEAPMQKEMF